MNISGKYFRIVPYGVSDDTETIDYEQVMAIAKECRPKLILAGASAYPRTLDFAKFREIADAVGARLVVTWPTCGSGGRPVFIPPPSPTPMW